MDQLKQLRMRQHRQTMLQMVSEIHQGKLNITQAANKFSVTRDTVKTWLDKVEDKALEHPVCEKVASTSKKFQSGRAKKDAAAQVDELMAKISLLEEELDAAKFKAIYYSTLIQVAEQELGLDIEKKSVTKQSGSF
jgi:transposase-like protein